MYLTSVRCISLGNEYHLSMISISNLIFSFLYRSSPFLSFLKSCRIRIYNHCHLPFQGQKDVYPKKLKDSLIKVATSWFLRTNTGRRCSKQTCTIEEVSEIRSLVKSIMQCTSTLSGIRFHQVTNADYMTLLFPFSSD